MVAVQEAASDVVTALEECYGIFIHVPFWPEPFSQGSPSLAYRLVEKP
jgi:hypothetical protein